jgi:hypothetical protein
MNALLEYIDAWRRHDIAGALRVEQWMRTWFGACGSVGSWEVIWHAGSMARLNGQKIAYLREYPTTAPLHDWMGAWRDS